MILRTWGAPFEAQGLRAMLRPYMMMANIGLRVTLSLTRTLKNLRVRHPRHLSCAMDLWR